MSATCWRSWTCGTGYRPRSSPTSPDSWCPVLARGSEVFRAIRRPARGAHDRGMTTVERSRRGARRLHAGIYLAVLVLLGTGWWFLIEGYGAASPLARLTGLSDFAIHTYAGYATVGVLLVWLARGARGLRMFVRETLR